MRQLSQICSFTIFVWGFSVLFVCLILYWVFLIAFPIDRVKVSHVVEEKGHGLGMQIQLEKNIAKEVQIVNDSCKIQLDI